MELQLFKEFQDSSGLQAAKLVCEKLTKNGFQALLAGGCVRDALLAIEPHDFDVATNAQPDQVLSLFMRTIPVGKSFGVIIVLQNNIQIEVATFRTEGPYEDGRHPSSIKFSTAQEDAQRRDFTINALFWDPSSKNVVDYVDGISDLQAKLIRVVGDPEKRFQEDHLRLLRALRFNGQLGFQIEEKTWKAIKDLAILIKDISGERIQQELEKLLTRSKDYQALRLLNESGLLQNILGPLNIPIEPDYYFDGTSDLKEKWLAFFVWIEAMKKVACEDLSFYLKNLKFSNQLSRSIVIGHQLFKQASTQTSVSFSQIRKSRFGELLEKSYDSDWWRGFKYCAQRFNELADLDKKLKKEKELWGKIKPKPWLTGKDLPSHLKGAQIGKVLREAYWRQLEGSFMTSEEAQEWGKAQ